MAATEHGQFEYEGSRVSGRPRAALRSHCSYRFRWTLLVAVGVLAALSGCQRLRLPAIDPTGSRIFLPPPNTTEFAVPPLTSRDGEPGFLPAPAFATPATPPPCIDGSCGDTGGFRNLMDRKHDFFRRFESPGKAGQIQLTPLKAIAPVGGEVVLLAGICGSDGYLVKRAPIEWMLSPESVGTFIEVGDDSSSKLINTLTGAPEVEKLDVDFARGRTSRKETIVTRGSPNLQEHIKIREGETWLSLSSPSEGVSRVTVLAPESEIWDRRRQTATIYWVDAQWGFPQPQIARSGETIELVTRVTKAENLVPAEGWLVKYTIIDPAVAMFVPSTGSNSLIVPVDRDGIARAQVAAPTSAWGTTAVEIEIIRPAQPLDNLPELPVGRGQTFVTFSSAGLQLQVFGPETGAIGEQLTYVASVGNPGDVDAENVRLTMIKPAGTRIVTAVPQPSSETNNGLLWDQGVLPARQQLDVSVVLEPLQPATFEVVFQTTAQPDLSRQQSVRTDVTAPSIEARFAPAGGVAQADVGNVVQYEIDITNNGRQTLTDLQLLIETDPGLPEAYQATNRVEQTIAMLQPGQTRSLGVAFRVQQEGQLGARLQVLSGTQVLAEKSTSIRGLPPKPKQPNIGISIDFPETVVVGQTNQATIVLRNPGEVRLSDIRVELAIDPALRPSGVDQANSVRFRTGADGRTATWTPPDLLPRMTGDSGDTIIPLTVAFDVMAQVAQGAIAVRASSAEGVSAEETATFRAIANQVEPPPPVTSPPEQARTGTWRISISEFGDPTTVGSQVRYRVRVTNDQNLPDRNVRVQLRVSQGVQFSSATLNGNPVNYEFGADNTVNFPTIQFVRSTESVDYDIVIVPQVPQQMVLRARVYSDSQPDPVEVAEETTVNARNN